MSGDMFKKMKERISDEVSSASNRLQNMQIIDQFATGVNQQILGHDHIPDQFLPMPPLPEASSHKNRGDKKYDNLVNIVAIDEYHDEEEELNSEISPQHQLFNEETIKRLTSHRNEGKLHPDMAASASQHGAHDGNELHQTVINIEELSSDLEDNEGVSADLMDDVEIDLLTDKEISRDEHPGDKISTDNHSSSSLYKTRYRNVVRTLRRLNETAAADKRKLKFEISELSNNLNVSRQELESLKRQANNQSPMSSVSNDDKTRSTGHGKSSGKIKDLEKLIAKCKESLKNKNSQLKILKDQLTNVDKFSDSFTELRGELNEIKNAHESWTVSVAENKRIMHQEIEGKNNVINQLKSDITELHSQLKENYSKSQQLKLTIQNLESRLVSTSAAHQKERESQRKELTLAKNQAIKQVQREHELQLERVKLNLEKSIEALKAEILNKDEILIKKTEQEQQLEERNRSLLCELDETKKKLDESLSIFNELRMLHEKCPTDLSTESKESVNKEQINESATFRAKITELETQIQDLQSKLEQSNAEKSKFELDLKQQEEQLAKQKAKASIQGPKECQDCALLKKQAIEASDRYKQSLFDITAQLDLMATANVDQEKALDAMRCDLMTANESLKSARSELEESSKKSEALVRVIRDNETELQNQQEHLDKFATLKRDFDDLKREHSAQAQSIENLKSELGERNSELNSAKSEIEKYKNEYSELELKSKTLTHSLDELIKEKETIRKNKVIESKARDDFEQKLILSILSAMKNLETPNTSPGSDKSFKLERTNSSGSNHGDISENRKQELPDPIGLVEKLSSLALERTNSQMVASQRLQAVLLDNSRLNDEVNRLREELNTISREKTQETLTSFDEIEKLRTENQALIHDQKSYDDQISELENEVEALKQELEVAISKQSVVTNEASTETTTANNFIDYEALLKSSQRDIDALKEIVHRQEQQLQLSNKSIEAGEIPDSTQFEYLKNIVYQFMLGREPLVLARVISAVFKFEPSQIEQICKAQEVVQAAIKPNI